MGKRSGRNAKSPAFQFYPGDFLADPKVQAMRAEEVGAYLLLLCAEWLDGPLPDDPGFLARVCRLGAAEFAQAWQAVGRCFKPAEGRAGFLENPRLERERAFQAEGRARRLDASRIAQEARLALESSTNRERDETQPLLESNPPLSPTPVALHPTPDSRSPAKGEKRAPRAAAPPPSFPASLDLPEFRESWTLWTQYRREKKAPLTPTGSKALLAKCADMGLARSLAALRHTMEMGWTGMREADAPGGMFGQPKGPPAKPAAVVVAEQSRAAREREVERLWEEKHTVVREVDSPLGGKVKRAVLDGRYPGYEAAQRELAQKATA